MEGRARPGWGVGEGRDLAWGQGKVELGLGSGARDPHDPLLLQDKEMQSYSTLKAVTTRATVSGLKPGTRYVFQVRARTSAGCGRFSQAVEVETGKPSECRGDPGLGVGEQTCRWEGRGGSYCTGSGKRTPAEPVPCLYEPWALSTPPGIVLVSSISISLKQSNHGTEEKNVLLKQPPTSRTTAQFAACRVIPAS